MEFFAALLVLAGLAWVAWHALNPKAEVKIVASGAGLVSQEGLSKKAEAELFEFFANDLRLTSRVVILGRRDAAGNMRFSMRGNLDAGSQQQIRNVLHTMVNPKPARDGSRNRCGEF